MTEPSEHPAPSAPSPDSPADGGTAQTLDAGLPTETSPTEARVLTPEERAKLESISLAMKGGAIRSSRSSVTWIILALVAISWALLASVIWFDSPGVVFYNPIPIQGEALPVGSGWQIGLIEGWTLGNDGRITGPGGGKLIVITSSVHVLRMSPRSLGGQKLTTSYTAASFGRFMRDRFRGDAQPPELLWTRYIRLGGREGAEACLRHPTLGYLRGLCLVESNQDVLFLEFSLPEGEGSAIWHTATRIFQSVRPKPPVVPPAPPPSAPASAEESPSPTHR